MTRSLLIIAVLALSCGAAPDMDQLCSDQPQIEQGVYETQAGCSYEQQTTNILAYGTQVSRAGVALQSAGQPSGAVVQQTCGRYLMGKDAQGVAVIVDTRSGSVMSHGLVHAGMAISSMPRTLSLPLKF